MNRVVEPRYLSLFQENPNLTPAPGQRLEVALVVPPGTAPNGEVGVRAFEGGLYATARVRVLLEDYAAQWDALVADWLPETDPEGKYHVEICLPVRPL